MNLSDMLEVQKLVNGKTQKCSSCKYYQRPFVNFSITDSPVIIIGEAPGKQEVEMNEPFVGESGIRLRQILTEVGFDQSAISYLNTVHCHPPNNETPDDKTIKLCSSSFLLRELSRLTPKIIILAGAVALKVFFPDKKITEARGKFFYKDGVAYLPVFHPAYCLRNPSYFSTLRTDLNSAKKYVDGVDEVNTLYKLVMNEDELMECRDLLMSKKIWAVDIETNKTLNPFDTKATIWTVAFGYDKNTAVCIPLWHDENINVPFRDKCFEVVKELLESEKTKIFHNGMFDVKFLRKFNIDVKNYAYDTMIMAYLLDENRASLSLKVLASEYTTGYTTAFSEKLEALAEYNCQDVDFTYQLYTIFSAELKKNVKLWQLFTQVLMPFCYVIIDMEWNGILIDVEYGSKLSKLLRDKVDALIRLIHEEYPEAVGTDLGSNKQLATLLFDRLKLEPTKMTKGGSRSVDAETLEMLSSKSRLAKYILKMREYQKFLSTYVENLPTMVESDNRLRGSFNICGTKTGRLSSSNPNMQNIPRDKSVKKMFTVPDGYMFMNIDASQSELRVGCSIANEKTMIEAYNKGIDIHRLTASKILNKSIEQVTPHERQEAKGVNFGFLYGSTAEGFKGYAEMVYGLRLSLDECIAFRKSFFSTYSGLEVWYKQIEETIKKNGYIEYPTGRRAHFPDAKGQSKVFGDVVRKAINYPVQGSSSDIVLYVMTRLRRFIKFSGVDVMFLVSVHDSIGLQIEDGLHPVIIDEITNICKYDIPDMFPWLKVPMVFDVQIGKNWGELENL